MSYGAAILALVLGAVAAYGFLGSRAATADVKIGAPAPDLTFTTIDGTEHRLAEFRGRPVMLWLFATWCPSCQAGTAAVAEHRAELERTGLQIIQLELYQDLGYPGPSIQDFARAYVRPGQESPAWLWGNASKALSYAYDPKGYPDIYFLIDRRGVVRGVAGGPGDAIAQIVSFAREGR
jgi:thiol-disulfide isomerase/thioredoxin